MTAVDLDQLYVTDRIHADKAPDRHMRAGGRARWAAPPASTRALSHITVVLASREEA